jgi:hypothetical protein|tara:strand:+ start:7849 stop:8241 length:393 start_codon:yes stop_codon:yes gene_type:complete
MATVSTTSLITLGFNGMNTSVQIGDIAYYSYDARNIGGFDHSTLPTTKKLGEIVGGDSANKPITGNFITVQYDNAIVSPPPPNAFISFAKEKKINTTNLVGYYADVKFINDSKEKIELFSVGSEISESSK